MTRRLLPTGDAGLSCTLFYIRRETVSLLPRTYE